MTEIEWIDQFCAFIMNHYVVYYLTTTVLGLLALEWSFRIHLGGRRG